jgi:DNA-binding response OmpR family regulator
MSAERILVVDDDRRLLRVLEFYLAMQRWEMVNAVDCGAALHLLESGDFGLVILDVMMPGCDGFEVCRQIRANSRTRSLPIVLLTTASTPDHVEAARQAGAHLLIKPFSFAELDKVIRGIFGHQLAGANEDVLRTVHADARQCLAHWA